MTALPEFDEFVRAGNELMLKLGPLTVAELQLVYASVARTVASGIPVDLEKFEFAVQIARQATNEQS